MQENGMLFTKEGFINIKNKKWENDFSEIDSNGTSYVDKRYSKSYLRHLFVSKEMLGLGARFIIYHFIYGLLKNPEKKLKMELLQRKNKMVKKLVEGALNPIMKKLDWFIVKKFLGTYVFMIAVVMSISIIFDVSEKLKDFMNPENNLTFYKIITQYYPYFFIHYANLFSSLFFFLSVLWFTSFMAQRLEIVAILSSGISFWRFSRPYIIASSFLLIISVLMNHYVAPFANKNRLTFEKSVQNIM